MRRPPSPKPDFGASQDTDENLPGAKGVKQSENLDKKPNHGANVFQCSGFGDCHMVFTRSEHLARHVRKHTGERPFKCHCFKAFSRLDNLRQHCQTVHSDTPEKNEEVLRKLTILHSNLAASAAKNQRCFTRNAAQDNVKQIQEANEKDSPPPKPAGKKHLSPMAEHSLSALSDAPAKERVPFKDEQGTCHESLPSVSYHTQPYYPTNRTAPRSTNYALPVPRTMSSRSSRALAPSPAYLHRSSGRPGSQSPSTLPAPNLHFGWGAQGGYGEFPKPHHVLPPLSQISASGSGERKRPTPSNSYPPPAIRDGPPVHMQMAPRRMTMPALYSSRGYVPAAEERVIYSPTYATRNVPSISGASHSGNRSGASLRSEPYSHTLQQPANEPPEVKSETQNSSSLTEKLARNETATAISAPENVDANADFLPRMPKCYRASYPHDQSAFNVRPASSASSLRQNDSEGMFAPSYHPSRYHPMRYRNEQNLLREKGMAVYASEYEHTYPTIPWYPSEEHALIRKHRPQYDSADLPPKQCFTRKRKACTEA